MGGSVALGSGELLVVGGDVLLLEQAIRAALDAQRRNGLAAPAEVRALSVLVGEAAARVRACAGSGSAAVPFPAVGEESVLMDPIDVPEASVLLGCEKRNVRDLCGRGVFASARRVGGRWVMERVEVELRAMRKAG
jgi:hypothetical protein